MKMVDEFYDVLCGTCGWGGSSEECDTDPYDSCWMGCPGCGGSDIQDNVDNSSGSDTPEPKVDLNVCPGCGGPADNGHDRCVPPNVYFCSRCDPIKTPTPENTSNTAGDSKE